ncbi:MAG TPA: M20/M25/M40 family metallo-hydrolase, partial [Thermoanaerobaculia bacterium]|nr:M20/M25/M40 family metallo-hydrolase [Thermoanaerobaculia bacterium]
FQDRLSPSMRSLLLRLCLVPALLLLSAGAAPPRPTQPARPGAPAVDAPNAPAVPEGLSEAARWLWGYLRIDTTNPPGHEHKSAAFLAEILHREGIPTRLLVTPEGRTSLYARLSAPARAGQARQATPAVLLLHHMDVVAAGPGWTVPPFQGLIRDGRMWGRGAVDDKSLGIAQLAAFLDLKRKKVPLERDVIYLAVADEENGGLRGTAWLLEKHPELFRGVEGVIGEGGRSQAAAGKLLWWGIEVAQKRPLWLEVSTSGRGGHASGLNPESANHRLIEGLARVLALPPRWRVTPPARDYLEAIAPLHNDHWKRVLTNIDATVDEKTGPREFLFPGMANLFLDTVQVTVLSGGNRINVIPASASARLDVRLLPDTDAEAFLARIREALGDGYAVKVLVTSPPAPPSPAGGRLYAAFQKVLSRDAPVVPTMVPGFTDSRFFRERGIPAYGITPFALEGDDLKGIHGPDERIPLDELDRGVERMRGILRAYAGRPG